MKYTTAPERTLRGCCAPKYPRKTYGFDVNKALCYNKDHFLQKAAQILEVFFVIQGKVGTGAPSIP